MDQPCTYCLDPADGYDHLMPVSRQTTRRRQGKMSSISERVPCCSVCNSLLGASPAFTVRDRAAVLILRYAERPRDEARDTYRKLKHLFEIVAGFDLGEEIERIDELQRRRFSDQFEAERQREADAEREIEERFDAEVKLEMQRQAEHEKKVRGLRAAWRKRERRDQAMKNGKAPAYGSEEARRLGERLMAALRKWNAERTTES
jgi:hypothetical protein